MKNLKCRYGTISLLSVWLLSSCSNSAPVDAESCRFYGDTIWDKCWWFNNSWLFGLGAAGAIYGWGWKILNDRRKKMNAGSGTEILYFLAGTSIILIGGSIMLTMIFESFLTSP